MRRDIVKKGSTRAAHRSLFNALGLTKTELKKPLIGVVNSFNELIPGHMHLREIAEAAKTGVWQAGGVPVEFPAIGICDGIAMRHDGMKYPLASRELVADSIEAMAKGHAFDGLVLIPNCDKIVPGMLMAAARLNIPCVVVSGGAMRAGYSNGTVLDFNSVMEKIGAFRNGDCTEGDLEEVASTRLLVYAATLIKSGFDVSAACRAALVETLTDDPETVEALMEIVNATFGR